MNILIPREVRCLADVAVDPGLERELLPEGGDSGTVVYLQRVMAQLTGFQNLHLQQSHSEAFKLECWRRLLRGPWTARRSNQSILKETNAEYSLEGLKLKHQYFGQLMWRADSLEKILMLRKIEGRRRKGNRRWDVWMASPTQWTWVWASSRRQWWTGKPGVL